MPQPSVEEALDVIKKALAVNAAPALPDRLATLLEKLRAADERQLAFIEDFFRIEEEAEREVEAERAKEKRSPKKSG